jgi:phosphoglycolate phosphatase-like HAD superfamily hydrolase
MKLLITFCLAPLLLWGEIRSIDRFEEIYQHVKPGSWVIVDIDGTLIDAAQMLGSTHWLYDHLQALVREEGHEPAEAAFRFEEKLGSIRASVPYTPMEEIIPEIIADLQARGHIVMALTHRPLSMYEATEKHLQSIGLDLTKTSPTRGDFWLPDLSRVRRGVVFVSDFGPKGRTLAYLFERLNVSPKDLVFIDDSEHNVTSVHTTCEQLGIPCRSLYYKLRKKRHASYSRELADIQLMALPQILSDQEASLRLRQQCASDSAG